MYPNLAFAAQSNRYIHALNVLFVFPLTIITAQMHLTPCGSYYCRSERGFLTHHAFAAYASANLVSDKPDITLLMSHFSGLKLNQKHDHCEFSYCFVCTLSISFAHACIIGTTSDIEIEAAIMSNLM